MEQQIILLKKHRKKKIQQFIAVNGLHLVFSNPRTTIYENNAIKLAEDNHIIRIYIYNHNNSLMNKICSFFNVNVI